jgi:uncharacterized protein YuzE
MHARRKAHVGVCGLSYLVGANRVCRHTFSLLFKMLDNYDLRVVISIKEEGFKNRYRSFSRYQEKKEARKMVRKLQIDYNEEEDILWLHEGKQVKDSLELDDFVIDFAASEVVGLEMMNASEVLTRYIQDKSKPAIKKMLGHIASANLRTQVKDDMIFIVAYILFEKADKTPAPVPVAVNLPKQVILAHT